jgi:Flp pilus assembly protein TadD, contains TPR repeats
MIYIDAADHYRKGSAYLEGQTHDGQPHERNMEKAEHIFHEVLNCNIGHPQCLFALGCIDLTRGRYGRAIQLLSQVTQMVPKFGEAWNNLGLAFKEIPDFDKAEFAMKKAAKYITGPYLADIYCNLAALKVSRGMAKDVLPFVDMALTLDPNHAKAKWHRALANLELRNWDTAWDDHEMRLHGGAPKEEIAERNYHGPDAMTPWWDGKSPGRIVIHGEQGIGDEIMFATVIPDALKVPGTEFIFEPSPRLHTVFERSLPAVKVHGTDKTNGVEWIEKWGKPDYKIGLGSLPKFFRRSNEAFPGTPYLVPSKAKRQWWGEKLRALGRRPNIGIAWQGGVPKTRGDARSFHPILYEPILKQIDANWISLQYDATAQHCVDEVKSHVGVRITHWPKAVEQKDPDTGKLSDIDELVALISRLDAVVTVCQTAVHIAGALGIPTICLVPNEPSWRYGNVESDEMPWYASVKLLRMPKDSRDWTPVIAQAGSLLHALVTSKDVAHAG